MLNEPLRHIVADNPFEIIPRYHPVKTFQRYIIPSKVIGIYIEYNVRCYSLIDEILPSSSAICLAIATVDGASEV